MDKILYIITKGEIGGAQKYVFNLAKTLKNECEIWIGAGEKKWLTESAENYQIPTIIFKNLRRSYNPLKNLLFVFELRKFLNQNSFDLVHLNSSNALFGILSAKLAKSKPKVIFTLHGLSILSPGWQKSKFIKFIYYLILKFFLKFTDRVIFVCENDKNFALKIGLVPKDKAILIYNGIELPLNFYSQKDARKALEEKTKLNLENKFIIGTNTRLEYAKNIELLVKTAAILKQNKAIFLVFGSGPEIDKITALIKKMGLENSFLIPGYVPEGYRYIKVFDIFVICSRYEGFPYAVLEAMSAELPIIATKVGGIPELIQNEQTGILIPPKNEEALAKAIKILAENPEKRKKLAENAKKYAEEKFGLDKMVAATKKAYSLGFRV